MLSPRVRRYSGEPFSTLLIPHSLHRDLLYALSHYASWVAFNRSFVLVGRSWVLWGLLEMPNTLLCFSNYFRAKFKVLVQHAITPGSILCKSITNAQCNNTPVQILASAKHTMLHNDIQFIF